LILDDAELQQLASTLPDDGELPYPVRRNIRLALGELGHDRVVSLGESCARRVVPIWSQAYPEDSLPIEVMNDALAGTNTDLDERLGFLRSNLDSIYDPDPPFGNAFAAGMACWAVANEAFEQETLEIDAEQEREFDPDYWPPCFYASVAEADGATWEDVSDNDKRANFWRWYLLDAVPAARDGR